MLQTNSRMQARERLTRNLYFKFRIAPYGWSEWDDYKFRCNKHMQIEDLAGLGRWKLDTFSISNTGAIKAPKEAQSDTHKYLSGYSRYDFNYSKGCNSFTNCQRWIVWRSINSLLSHTMSNIYAISIISLAYCTGLSRCSVWVRIWNNTIGLKSAAVIQGRKWGVIQRRDATTIFCGCEGDLLKALEPTI